MKSLTMFLVSESYFHKFRFSYWFQSFHVKCRPPVMLQNIGDFGLNFLNLTPLIQNPGSATVPLSFVFGLVKINTINGSWENCRYLRRQMYFLVSFLNFFGVLSRTVCSFQGPPVIASTSTLCQHLLCLSHWHKCIWLAIKSLIDWCGFTCSISPSPHEDVGISSDRRLTSVIARRECAPEDQRRDSFGCATSYNFYWRDYGMTNKC